MIIVFVFQYPSSGCNAGLTQIPWWHKLYGYICWKTKTGVESGVNVVAILYIFPHKDLEPYLSVYGTCDMELSHNQIVNKCPWVHLKLGMHHEIGKI